MNDIDDSQMNKQIMLTRDVTMKECDWLERDYKKGKLLYLYSGHTYGCIDSGVACTEIRGRTPFFEIPLGSYKLMEKIVRSIIDG